MLHVLDSCPVLGCLPVVHASALRNLVIHHVNEASIWCAAVVGRPKDLFLSREPWNAREIMARDVSGALEVVSSRVAVCEFPAWITEVSIKILNFGSGLTFGVCALGFRPTSEWLVGGV